MDARKRIEELEIALQGRQLIYFGTRGADAGALLAIPNFSSVFSLVAPLQASTVHEFCMETVTKERVDLDDYCIDFDERPVVSEMRQKLLHALERPSALLPYRPCAFLSSAWFPRSDRVKYLGLFHGLQACFEHKAWVETQLSSAGVPVLPWRFFADEEAMIIKEWAETESLVLRANRTDGGVGVRFVPNPKALESEWPSHSDGFIAATSYLHGSLSLNLNACIFADGSISLHGPSVQVIGVPALTRRHFGYCGNDFSAASALDTAIMDAFEHLSMSTAHWLHSQGYLGAFGIDALVHEGQVFLTEINPRFQGSSLISARLDTSMDRSNILMEHAAAFLGLKARNSEPLRELALAQPPMAHAIFHNTSKNMIRVADTDVDGLDIECRLIAGSDVKVHVDGITFEAVFPRTITDAMGKLTSEAENVIDSLKQRFTHME
jgi:ATP-grasp domain